MVPCSVLPAAARTSGISMPWSMELRTRCTSGSPIFSSTVLSSSVVSPVTFSSIFLPRRWPRSRTRRGKRLNTKLMGNMRTRMTLSCSARMWRSSCASALRNSPASRPSSGAASWLNTDWVITSSPTEFSSSSIFSMLTRIDPPSGLALRVEASACGAALPPLRPPAADGHRQRRAGVALAPAGSPPMRSMVSSHSLSAHSNTACTAARSISP